MAAFERVKSGIPAMDKVLDNIRLGDNVVWRVSDLKDVNGGTVVLPPADVEPDFAELHVGSDAIAGKLPPGAGYRPRHSMRVKPRMPP